MSYMLRDRPDGQVEIILSRQILVGIFPERDVAQRVCAWLSADEPELTDDCPACFGRANHDVDLAETEDLEDLAGQDDGEARLRTLVERSRNDAAPASAPPGPSGICLRWCQRSLLPRFS